MRLTARLALSALAVSSALLAQTTPANTANLLIRSTLPDSVADIADGATVNMPVAGLNQTLAASITVTNRGTTVPTVNFVTLNGSADFTISGVPETPFALATNQAFGAQVIYKATTSLRTTTRLTINYTVGTATFNVNVNFVGTAPEFGFSVIPQGGNATAVNDGATIAFPQTAVDGTASATIVIANRGTYQGVFNGATITGDGFATVGVPLTGTVVEAGRDIRFGVQFNPKALGEFSGRVSINTTGSPFTLLLTGTSTGARFNYELLTGTAAAPLRPGAQIALADALVGEKSTQVVRFRNSGNAEGRIAVINATGTGFTLTEVPLLPLVVPAGETFAFTINFSPTAPGRHLGRLRIGTDDFELSSNGLGATIQYSYTGNNVTTTVASGGSAIFTPAAVGGASELRFTISNTGTANATVSSIGLAAPTTVFTLGTLPALPATLRPNESISFPVTFSPNVLGTSTATLRVDNATFTLSGAGNAPPPLPAIRFDGAAGAQEPLQQPAIGLTLASNYPLALNGTLTLTFNSDVFSNDPAVQFAAGGRTVNFTIPANTTRAIFANNAQNVRVQTGSVAGTITITPSISTADGAINLTPTTPPTANLTVAAGAPRILSVALGAKTATSITLLISGYTTARTVSTIGLNFTPTTGETVGTTQLSLPVESAFLGWFSGANSTPFGGLFTVTVPLTLAGDVKNVTQVSDTVQSVSVTLTNRVGSSPATSLTLR